MNNGFNNEFDQNNPYNIFDNRGRPKNIIWSVISLISGILSITLSMLGWAGLILGVFAIASSVVARKKLGYFNGFAVAGLITGIFGTVSSIAIIIISMTNPALLEEVLGNMGNTGGTQGGSGVGNNDTNNSI